MMNKKFSIKELVDDTYKYQPPEIRDKAIIFVETKEGGMQIVDAHRDIVTADGGKYEALLLTPYQPLTAKNPVKAPESPEKCSKCGKTDIQTFDPPLFESDDRISVTMQCQDCGHKWHEYFDLTEVVEEND